MAFLFWEKLFLSKMKKKIHPPWAVRVGSAFFLLIMIGFVFCSMVCNSGSRRPEVSANVLKDSVLFQLSLSVKNDLHCYVYHLKWQCKKQIPHKMKICAEFNLAPWLRLVKFMGLNISKFWFFNFNQVIIERFLKI